ncbi:hypothetical protein [Pseudomonas sp. Marseille-Q5299]|uniref:hypothetical protein n=1 Tax=Pseudomonas sp. Marseille-Q5299 TaxID=2942201 RepID=UPI0020737D2E|nr:hypothetical protein [Pseudomonas sp. Marseille-Q5299]
MSAFIDQQNEQARLFCENFDQEYLRGHGFAYDDERDELLVSGISGFEYDLEGVFKGEFPSYVIESQVIMLWAMLERNLDAIAMELYKIKGLDWSSLKRGASSFSQYIERIEVADGRPFPKPTVDFLDKNVREVRNALVHGGAREVDIEHAHLDIKGKVLRGVSPAYVSEVIGAMRYLAMDLVAAHR